MKYVIENGLLIFLYYSPQLRGKVGKVEAKVPLGISNSELVSIAEAVVMLLSGLSFSSFSITCLALAGIFSYFLEHGRSWPKANEWPTEVFNIYCYQLRGFSSSRTVDSSRENWNRMRRVLSALMSKHIIPSCKMPSANLPRNSRRELHEVMALGEAYEPVPPGSSSVEGVIPKQYLVDLSYLQEPDDFFQTIQDELERVSSIALNVNLKYWCDLREGHAIGRDLIGSVTRDELMVAINDPENNHWPRRGKIHPADPEAPRGIAYFLAAVHYYFFEVGSLRVVNLGALREIPFFEAICRNYRRRDALFKKLSLTLKVSYVSGPDLIARGLGLLSTRDCSAIAAILIHEQPRFTPGSLETAEIYDKNGKSHVSLTDAGGEYVFFTIAKHRARSRKGGVLTERASKILVALHEITSPLRAKLLKEQPDVARQLFLVVSKVGIGHVGRIGSSFNKRYSVFSVYKDELEVAGMSRSTFTLSRIRNTEGILVWLKTEALISMAEAMGNKVKTILNNYIPDWLYHKMLCNSARRLGQKIIVLATAGEKWQLSVTDFATVERLEAFVIKTLASDLRGNPLSEYFYNTYSGVASAAAKDVYESAGNEFYICVSPESIAALEVYVRFFSRSTTALREDSVERYLDFKKMARLYQLIYSTVHADSDHESSSLVVDLLSGGSRAHLKSVWAKSRLLVEEFSKLAFLLYNK